MPNVDAFMGKFKAIPPSAKNKVGRIFQGERKKNKHQNRWYLDASTIFLVMSIYFKAEIKCTTVFFFGISVTSLQEFTNIISKSVRGLFSNSESSQIIGPTKF